MGLFDKKYCDICGEKIGLLGNRKLEDGNLCKDCAKKLSPWFSDRRRSTVEDIKEQLAYREENRGRAAQFRITRTYGESWKVLIDEEHRWFTVTRARDLAEANPDILDFDAITGCRLDIDENRTELLVQRGGTNLLAALLYFGIMCLLQVAILYMAGPSAIQYLMTMAGA